MQKAINEACAGASSGETPVGAVLVNAQTKFVLARAHNECISRKDPTAHAEIMALRRAGSIIDNYRMPDTVMVVTLEPCLMCIGAMVQARISGLVFGARDPVSGAVVSRLDIHDLQWLNHKFWFMDSILEHECAKLLQDFFQKKRDRVTTA